MGHFKRNLNLINTKLNGLSEFEKPKNYPKGFEEKHMTGCISWKCLSDKSATEKYSGSKIIFGATYFATQNALVGGTQVTE